MDINRREFARTALGSATLFALSDLLFGKKDLFAAPIRPFAGHWLAELDAIGREVKSDKLQQVEWQKKVEELYSKVDLAEFLKMIDFETLKKKLDPFQGKGALSLGVNFAKVEGIPTKFIFGRQLFAMKKGRSIIPHGHDSMSTAFLVVQGTCRGRHFDRISDEKEHMIVVPTIDHEFKEGGTSTISDKKDNVHWFEALSDTAFVFNIHVDGMPGNPKNPGRVYIDPNGEKIEGGKIRARLIDHDEANKLYG
ncbi:MAG TPA: hypothetical protein VEN81_15640 [Planctomycetota bacterium]|nr:hypothetical protein [Planctomycetota bacterium]